MGCKICAHRERKHIETALVENISLRRIEELFKGVEKSALSRHKRQHMSDISVAEAAAEVIEAKKLVESQPRTAAEKLTHLYKTLAEIICRSMRNKNLGVAVQAAKTQLDVINAEARLTGEVGAPSAVLSLEFFDGLIRGHEKQKHGERTIDVAPSTDLLN